MFALVHGCLDFCCSFDLKKTLPKLTTGYVLLELFNKCAYKANAQCLNHTVIELNGRIYEWVAQIQPNYLFQRESFNSCIAAMCPDLQSMMSKFGAWAYSTGNNRTIEAAILGFYNFSSNVHQLNISIANNADEMLEVFGQYCGNYSCVLEDLISLEGQWKACADPDATKDMVKAIIALCSLIAFMAVPALCVRFCCREPQPQNSSTQARMAMPPRNQQIHDRLIVEDEV